MTGRPAELIGVRTKDLRIKYRYGRSQRGFYARWRPRLKLWECQLSGASMVPRRWFSPTQTMALAEVRLLPSLFRWSHKYVDESLNWDNVPDCGFVGRHGASQLDLFTAPVWGVGQRPTVNLANLPVPVAGLVVGGADVQHITVSSENAVAVAVLV